jgi:hypothetical protein
MISPAQIQDLNAMPSEDLRSLMAHAAGIHAHRDGDGGLLIADALHRIADRLESKPRQERTA